jgi:hypothetical protein
MENFTQGLTSSALFHTINKNLKDQVEVIKSLNGHYVVFFQDVLFNQTGKKVESMYLCNVESSNELLSSFWLSGWKPFNAKALENRNFTQTP